MKFNIEEEKSQTSHSDSSQMHNKDCKLHAEVVINLKAAYKKVNILYINICIYIYIKY